MTPEDFRRVFDRLTSHGIEPATLHNLERVCIALQTGDAPTLGRLDGSRFGGQPFAPEDFGWPEPSGDHLPEGAEYTFFAQIAFGEIPDPRDILPHEGLLLLFRLIDPEGMVSSVMPGYVHGVFFPGTDRDGFRLHEVPQSRAYRNFVGYMIDATAAEHGFDITATAGTGLPMMSSDLADSGLTDDQIDTLTDLVSDHTSNHMLGYPWHNSLIESPVPSEDHVLLFSLEACDELGWEWPDGDTLSVFIEQAKLTAGDFSVLDAAAG